MTYLAFTKTDERIHCRQTVEEKKHINLESFQNFIKHITLGKTFFVHKEFIKLNKNIKREIHIKTHKIINDGKRVLKGCSTVNADRRFCRRLARVDSSRPKSSSEKGTHRQTSNDQQNTVTRSASVVRALRSIGQSVAPKPRLHFAHAIEDCRTRVESKERKRRREKSMRWVQKRREY